MNSKTIKKMLGVHHGFCSKCWRSIFSIHSMLGVCIAARPQNFCGRPDQNSQLVSSFWNRQPMPTTLQLINQFLHQYYFYCSVHILIFELRIHVIHRISNLLKNNCFNLALVDLLVIIIYFVFILVFVFPFFCILLNYF